MSNIRGQVDRITAFDFSMHQFSQTNLGQEPRFAVLALHSSDLAASWPSMASDSDYIAIIPSAPRTENTIKIKYNEQNQ